MSAVPFVRPGYLVVDLRAVLSMVGRILSFLSITMLAPIAVAVLYDEPVAPFVVALAVGLAGGQALEVVCGRRSERVTVREAFAVVALTWALAALWGGVPFMVEGGDLSMPIDAYFETMSGFTTTGSTVIVDFSSHGHAIFFWRALTQWLGGMGIVALAIAVLGRTGPGGKALLEREAPGPDSDKLTPRIRDTALHLWLVYIGLSVVMAAILIAISMIDARQGMGLYNAVVHTFTTMSTGGFSPEPRSIETFGWAAEIVITIFMVIAGANFALWYLTVKRHWGAALRDGEFRVYVAVLASASVLAAVGLVATTDKDLLSALGEGTFQIVSMMTTTGYASQDFAVWESFSLLVLFLVMFIGGCAGSTGGAIKVIRLRLAAGGMRRDIETAVHPETVRAVRVNGRPVRDSAIQGATVFAGIYVAAWFAGTLLLLLDCTLHGVQQGVFMAMVSAATTIGNVGPSIGWAGPMGSFAGYPAESKLLLAGLMWVGRLEIIPVFVLFTRAYWRR
ncbi:MAG: TrkH family potassium uptake protein [Gaiellales bacterium]